MCHRPCEDTSVQRQVICTFNNSKLTSATSPSWSASLFSPSSSLSVLSTDLHSRMEASSPLDFEGNPLLGNETRSGDGGASGKTNGAPQVSIFLHFKSRTSCCIYSMPLLIAQIVVLWYYNSVLHQSLYRVLGLT